MIIDLTTIVVGVGAIHIFDTAGNFRKRIMPFDGAAGDEFEHSFKISGRIIADGAPMAFVNGVQTGAA